MKVGVGLNRKAFEMIILSAEKLLLSFKFIIAINLRRINIRSVLQAISVFFNMLLVTN